MGVQEPGRGSSIPGTATGGRRTMNGLVEHLHPEALPKNPTFTNVVAVSGPVKTVYIGGQNAVDPNGEIVGKGDLAAQTEQIFRNLESALAVAGARLEHVIKFTLYLVVGQDLMPGFEVYQRAWGGRPNPPLVTAAFVSELAHPDFLLELEAVAVVPEEANG
jgi:enamine deaminase RidA (YjgF/YER057c/UK114 family)